MKRNLGILMPIFSLPGKFGIGDFGKEAYAFIDYLEKANVSVWQILPLVQTGYGNSPYSSVSSESFNPYFISLEGLKDEKLLTASEIKTAEIDKEFIDYKLLHDKRYALLKKAYTRFDKTSEEFIKCVKSKEFNDYAIFMSLKEKTNDLPFYKWEEGLRYRDKRALKEYEKENLEDILFWVFLQFTAKKQWLKLKEYATKKNIKIMGDMPLYVALDSVDVWKAPNLYKLDENFTPKKVAGVPPDYFSKNGQLWGNPVYDYDEHKKDGFSWWVKRIKKALTYYDLVRIDHFRGLDRYYEIEYGKETAIEGEWIDVPSKELFDSIHKTIGKNKIIAEDLGIIDDGVRELLSYTGYPGMKILSFAFNGDKGNLYLPENINENSVCYTGTHDNDTLIGLIENASNWDKNNLILGVKESLYKFGINHDVSTKESLAKAIILLGAMSKAKLYILPFSDVLMKDSVFRINEPGTVKEQNWAVRFSKGDFSKTSINAIKNLVKISGR